ncbi:hypothetical protein TCAL_13715 [Tigriopus californicus]|uniref:SHSP domain-containing protein n=1 Tax=Tigriopus californicus TaxID=6832 RepID=A0A553N7X8_TIGCA|nr:uncharacterized protein LOC131884815 [Tigriopus californicus]TRY61545.1 hypothetical protein TCAL_13715 [Tigriopus californicus]|eukprot:TCALIF_13715-PA protein Name:"Similar to CRYAB Alpha-crystallin B chain (Gallus gallus)" AED:0.02 eAED:0.02 QI:0/-1/0/1/-1/1/1/0/270
MPGETNSVPLTLRDSFFKDDFFRSAWNDFDRVREEMTRESREFWSRVRLHQAVPALDDATQHGSLKNAQDKIENKSSTCSSSSHQLQQQHQSSRSQSEKQISNSSSTSSSSSDRKNKALARPEDFFSGPSFFPKWMMPTMGCDWDDFGFFGSPIMKDLDLFQHTDRQMVRMTNDDKKFELSLDTHEFQPNEIKVNVTGNALSVEAKHEEKADDCFLSRQFSRKYTLPEGCEAHKVQSNLSADGVLVITAPKKMTRMTQEGPRAIPVTVQT